MPDPLDGLFAPPTPIDPDPAFAHRLRERLRRKLLEPEGAVMPTRAVTDPSELAWGPAVTPYLMVNDARALDWYVDVFAAERRGEAHVRADGTLEHAELGIGDAVVMLAEDRELDPTAARPLTQFLFVTVPDADATIARAAAAGAVLEQAAADAPYGRTGVVVDPFGHRWMINTPPPRFTRSRPGDIVYLTIWVHDQARAQAFYDSVLGWRLHEGKTTPTVSIAGLDHPAAAGRDPATVPVFRVADLDEARARVRDAGGRAEIVHERAYGRIAECHDPDGTWFELWEAPR
jgi:uncharacterized glyoxalase superfamily protein PhnB